jgi:hypothetical protein
MTKRQDTSAAAAEGPPGFTRQASARGPAPICQPVGAGKPGDLAGLFALVPPPRRDNRLHFNYTTASDNERPARPLRQPITGRCPRRRGLVTRGGTAVSIVRVGLGETKKFGEGYDAIFGKNKKKSAADKKTKAAKAKKPARAKKK